MQHTSTPQRVQGLRTSTSQDYLERMLRLQRYIADHLDNEDLDPDALASVACMSRAHFHRIFRAMFNETIMQHLRRLRLERAALRLRFHEATILELALDAGYGSHEAFSRAFLTHFGLSPSAYRSAPSPRVQMAQSPMLPTSELEVNLQHMPERHVLSLRHWGSYLTVSKTFERLVHWSMQRGYVMGEPTLFGIFHDDPEITPQDRLRSDICVVPNVPCQAEGEFVTLTIPGGTYAVALHRGPYNTLPQTYLQLIGRWLPTSRYALCIEGVVESYLNSPHNTPPDQLLTQVCVRLQPA